MLIGYIYNQLDLGQLPHFAQLISNGYKNVFVTTRNGIFLGLGYVSSGMMLYNFTNKLIKHKFNITEFFAYFILLALSFVLYYYYQELPFALIIGASIVFIISIKIKLPKSSAYSVIRKQSILIYFIHMYFIYSLNNVCQYYQFNHYILWLLCAISTTLVSYILIKWSNHKSGKWINHLI